MRLLSAKVRNYRILGNAEVVFDPSRTVIGGVNETGKSTLAEAIHRALFLRARTGGSVHREMISTTCPGHPEVEVCFEAGDRQYRVFKRFTGNPNGAAKLDEVGSRSWNGDEAESRLHALLGVESATGKAVREQWAHLWVWQGSSLDDPSAGANYVQGNLLRRLQQSGGAAVMQSARDEQVASRISERYAASYTAGGKAKSGSDLDRALSDLGKSEQALQQAQQRIESLRQAAIDFEEATSSIEQSESSLKSIGAALEASRAKLEKANTLRLLEAQQVEDCKSKRKELQGLDDNESAIQRLRKEITDAEIALEPLRGRISALKESLDRSREASREAGQGHEAALEQSRRLRGQREFFRAWIERVECQDRCGELETRLNEAKQIGKQLETKRETLAALPDIGRKDLSKLQKIQAKLDQANAALQAMGTQILVESLADDLTIGGEGAKEGRTYTLSEDTPICAGDGLRLLVRPGGGSGLTERRTEVAILRNEVEEALARFGLPSLAAAEEACARREPLEAKIKQLESRLEDMDPDKLEVDHADARLQVGKLVANLELRREQARVVEEPGTLAEARVALAAAERALDEAESAENALKVSVDAAAGDAARKDAEWQKTSAELTTQERSLSDNHVRVGLLLETHGDDQARRLQRKAAEEVCATADAALAETQRQLVELESDQLEADVERLDRALHSLTQARLDAMTRRAGSEALLRLDGSEDPQAELVRAQVRYEGAKSHADRVDSKARAIGLLNRLFMEQKAALADRFTQPLADKIASYLTCLFGSDVRVLVEFEDNAFKGLKLARPGLPPLPFEALSGGTREQVAAAVRLAMAEVLAADHGGCLPLVFDDAFAYSDPERVQKLQRMLDRAAIGGLQVVVLSCNPADYATLGARAVSLPKPTLATHPVSSPLGEPEEVGADEMETTPPRGPVELPPASPEDCEQFIDSLRGEGGKSGNKTLQARLGWEDARYESVKQHMLASGTIVPGRGRGGSVVLSS